eukprot:11390823-Alexandrium_andersonii.AAC.1
MLRVNTGRVDTGLVSTRSASTPRAWQTRTVWTHCARKRGSRHHDMPVYHDKTVQQMPAWRLRNTVKI